MDAAMVREWDKWNEFGVTKFLSKKHLNDIVKRNPDQKIVGTRWVFTERASQTTRLDWSFKGVKRTRVTSGLMHPLDRETPSSQRSQQQLKAAGITACSMPSQRTSSQTASRDYCCCGCLTKIRLLGRSQGKCLLQLVRSTGRETLDVRGTSTARKVLEAAGFVESGPEQGLYYLHGPSGLEALVHTHVDNFLSASKKASKKYNYALQLLRTSFI